VTPTLEVARQVQASLAYVAEAMRPSRAGATYVNLLDLYAMNVTLPAIRRIFDAEIPTCSGRSTPAR